ncbi:MAG: ThiF family adenylyltransferase [Candidatus Vogelbacteria bacterium]|nr:ThiF family adenylyltransferase [Candidatus Vogelbacteria bacterium]
MEEKRYSRHLAFFGVEGQKAIQNAKVAIIGCGGLGSHLAQQLAYLGVRRFILVDADHVEESNLNRLIGAISEDVEKNRFKSDIISRLIKMISSESSVITLSHSVIHESAIQLLQDSDILFGCVDNDSVRLFLTHYTSILGTPYIDLSSEILDGGEEFGGRVMFSLNGESCLMCMGELDQNEIRRGFSTDTEKNIDDRMYGVSQELLDGSGPSVVSINGAVASLAVTEFMVWRTGIRVPKKLLKYYGRKAEIRQSRDTPLKDCYYCKGIYKLKDVGQLRNYYH